MLSRLSRWHSYSGENKSPLAISTMFAALRCLLMVIFAVKAICMTNIAGGAPISASKPININKTVNSVNTSKPIAVEAVTIDHKVKTNEKVLKIAVVTWNLAEKSPTLNDCAFIRNLTKHDVVVLGLQECEDVRPRRTEGRRSRKWRQLRNTIIPKRSFECLGEHKLGGIQLAIYINKAASKLIEGVQTIEVACGVGNVLTNKGAVCMLLRFRNQRTVAFINAHLAAHQSKVANRNADYHRIIETINEKAHKAWLRRQPKTSKRTDVNRSKKLRDLQRALAESNSDKAKNVNELFDGTIFFGDLNYRMNLPKIKTELFCKDFAPELVVKSIKGPKKASNDDHTTLPSSTKKKMQFVVATGEEPVFEKRLSKLLRHDQLKTEIRFGAAFEDFREAGISFPPTFKYDKQSTTFDTSKKGRAPAWTDRVLFASKDESLIQALDYSAYDVRASDHRPVVASLVLKYPEPPK